MNLGNRGSRDCGFNKRRKQSFERKGELALDQRTSLRSWKWGQAILQARQIEGDLFAEEIGSGRQELAEFDEARPELGEGRGEALPRAQRAGAPTARKATAEAEEGCGGR